MSKRVFLLCNAHLDPVWQWEWEEGAAEALSTFRIAADFCEQYEDFIFCHNEALLYQWIEEYDPSLFARITDLTARGKWHIMGGWHLQPDCNMPSGEAFVRQILAGRRYFAEKFGKAPTVAVNVDPFGHTRGLVQIMAKCGYTGYLFMRPNENDLTLPAEQFRWVGYDGSAVTAVRMKGGYNSPKGKAAEKAAHYLHECPDGDSVLCLWGIGNHGGGPSKKDLDDLTALIAETANAGDEMLHSTPEAYFATLDNKNLPPHAGSLNSWSPGCYTSQIRIKQKYRAAENAYLLAEAMAAHAATAGMPFPAQELEAALYDINTVQFHDMLPGSSIQPAEEMSLRMLDHGLELLSRVRARAFFALAAGQPKSAEDTIPIFVYNPYPYAVETDVTAEFMLWDQNWNIEFLQPIVYDEHGVRCAAQCEKEHSTIPLEWRKRVVFRATLAPMTMNRFACGFETIPQKPTPSAETEGNCFRLTGGGKTLLVDRQSGRVTALYDAERTYLTDAFALEVFRDNHDPWFMEDSAWREKIGEFTLLTPEETAEYCCLNAPLEAVHVIESGDVRTVVEAVFGYNTSRAVVQYLFSADGTLDVKVRLNWNEKQKMARLALPAAFQMTDCIGEQAYGAEPLPRNMKEGVAGRYHLLCGKDAAVAVANNGTYGAAFEDAANTLHVTLLRSPSYCAHPIPNRTVMPQDRYMPYIEQGERDYAFRITSGAPDGVCSDAPRMAQQFNMPPMALSFYPTGAGDKPTAPLTLADNDTVQWTALKQAEDQNGWVVRLFNPTDRPQAATVQWECDKTTVTFGAYEIKTLRYLNGEWHETDLCENIQ